MITLLLRTRDKYDYLALADPSEFKYSFDSFTIIKKLPLLNIICLEEVIEITETKLKVAMV